MSWRAVEIYLTRRYPDYVNKSCGLHVHVSFKSMNDYSKVISPAFVEWFRNNMKVWGREVGITNAHYYSRLDGCNDFCRLIEDDNHILRQLRARHKENYRYGIWNFCFSIRGTAECRVLPMFKDRAIACKAVKQVLALTEQWCAEHRDAADLEIETEFDAETENLKIKELVEEDTSLIFKRKETVVCV
jgi:hypothetical protein